MRKQIVTSWTLRLFLIIRSDQRDLESFWTVRKLSYLNCISLNSEYLVNVWIFYDSYIHTWCLVPMVLELRQYIHTWCLVPMVLELRNCLYFQLYQKLLAWCGQRDAWCQISLCPNSLTQHPSHNHAHTYTHIHRHTYIRKQASTHSGHIYWDKNRNRFVIRSCPRSRIDTVPSWSISICLID